MTSNAMMPLLRNLCLLLGSCAVGLLLCEGSLRLFYPKYEPLAKARYRFDMMRLWARNPNDRAKHSHPDTGSWHVLHHNNLALRQHRNFGAADLAFATNVGVFGDSFIENRGMDAPYSLTEPLDYLLNQRGQPFNVLNFGVAGYGPGQSLLHYKHFRYAEALAYVFYVYFENDLIDLVNRNLFHLDETGRLVQHEAIRSSLEVTWMSRWHLPYLILDARGHLSSYMMKERRRHKRRKLILRRERRHRIDLMKNENTRDEIFKEGLRVFRPLIRRWKQLVEHNGGKFYVVLLPNHNPAASPRIPDLLQEEAIATISLYDCFGAHDETHYQRPWSGSPYRFKTDYHWNEAGNRLAAMCLYRVLEADMRLPTLAEETLRATLHRYYAAFGGWMPMNTRGGGTETLVSSSMAAGIREKYQALDTIRLPMSALAEPLDTRIIRSVFDVYLSGKSLIYHKQDCRLADLSSRFFLHITPVDETDLPEHRVRYGFENRDFQADSFQVRRNTCAVETRLPDYTVRHIRTGQYIPGQEKLWEGEALIDPPPHRTGLRP